MKEPKSEAANQDGESALASAHGWAAVWNSEQPRQGGWWWLDRDGDMRIVRVVPLRAYGSRLYAFVEKEWLPVDDLTLDAVPARWSGPIPQPGEPPKPADLRQDAGSEHGT